MIVLFVMIPQVFDRIYMLQLPIPFPIKTTNVHFIDESPRTVIDTGIKAEAPLEALRKGMEALGFRLHYLERILLPHGHIDHHGQAKKPPPPSGAPIYIHSKEYGKIRSALHSLGFLKSILLRNGVPKGLVEEAIRYIESAQTLADPLEEAFFLTDGDTIPFQSMTWTAVHCPGHSPGLLCFHWPEKKTMFTSNHPLKKVTPTPTLMVSENVFPFRYPSLREYLTSLEKIQNMDLSLLPPGPGEMIQDPKALSQQFFSHHRERTELITAILSKGD